MSDTPERIKEDKIAYQAKRIAELEAALEAAKNHTVMHWRTKDMLRKK